MFQIDTMEVVMRIIALLIAIPIHEFAHALSAVNNGDDGPRRAGRLSIMPWDHFDPFGAIFCVMSTIAGFGLGWGKPVLVNPDMLRDRRWGMCKIAVWGPFSNLLLAIAFALPLRFGMVDGTMAQLFHTCVIVNLSLMLFNLIPVGPLDGAKVAAAFMAPPQAHSFWRFQEQWGMLMLFGLITIGRPLLNLLVGVPLLQIYLLLVGL